MSRVTILDVVMISVYFIVTFIISQAWEHRLNAIFFGSAILILVIYIISSLTGFLGNILSLRKPFWLISGIIHIPVWIILQLSPSSTGQDFNAQNALVKLFGDSFFNVSTNGWVVPITETIIMSAILVGIWIKAKDPNSDKAQDILKSFKSSKSPAGAILVIFFALIGSFIHYVVALSLAEKGIVEFNLFMVHQFLSFYVFTFETVAFGLPVSLPSHIIKNLLSFAGLPAFLVAFLIFALLDFISVKTAPKSSSTKFIKATVKI